MVPGSTLRYGSSFCMVTRRPRDFSRRPSEEAVRPLPSEEATPPVTKMCFVTGDHHIVRRRRDPRMVSAYPVETTERWDPMSGHEHDGPSETDMKRAAETKLR